MYVLYFISVALHILATIVLLEKIWLAESCFGISGKSRTLYAIVFSFRYVESVIGFRCCVHINDISYIFSTLLLVLSYIICYSIYGKFRKTYDRNHDTVRIAYLIVSMTFIVLFFDYDSAVSESIQAFSNYLECVAILPQLFMIFKAGKIEKIVLYYLVILACSTAFSAAHYSIHSAPWTASHGVLFGLADLIYCCFFLCIWRGKIKICSYDKQANNIYKPNDNSHLLREYLKEEELRRNEFTNNFYKSNLKQCTLSLETNEGFQKYEDDKISKTVQEATDPKAAMPEESPNIWPVGVHIVKNSDHLTTKFLP